MKQSEAFIKTFPFTLLATVVITLLLIFLVDKYIGYSFLLGAMVSIMAMSMLYKSSNNVLHLPKQQAERAAARNYAMRYGLYAVVLVAAGFSDNLQVLVVAGGLFMFKIVLMIVLFFERRGGNND